MTEGLNTSLLPVFWKLFVQVVNLHFCASRWFIISLCVVVFFFMPVSQQHNMSLAPGRNLDSSTFRPCSTLSLRLALYGLHTLQAAAPAFPCCASSERKEGSGDMEGALPPCQRWLRASLLKVPAWDWSQFTKRSAYPGRDQVTLTEVHCHSNSHSIAHTVTQWDSAARGRQAGMWSDTVQQPLPTTTTKTICVSAWQKLSRSVVITGRGLCKSRLFSRDGMTIFFLWVLCFSRAG